MMFAVLAKYNISFNKNTSESAAICAHFFSDESLKCRTLAATA